MTELLARLSSVTVSYRHSRALDDVSLDIHQGQRLAIIGESGSGKTTLGLALAGLLPDNATISGRIDWPSLGRPPTPGRDYGFIFQDPAASLNPFLTVGEQIAEVVRQHLGLNWSAAYRQARDLMERVRIPQPDAALHAYPHQLSGGQRQRVCIASAIAAKPKFLIADEPTSALDMIVQAEILSLLEGLVREERLTMIFITHDLALASSFADRVAVLHNSRLVETGPTRQVLDEPKNEYTQALVADHIDLSTPPLVVINAE